MDRYKTHPNSSIFNFKRIQNDFQTAIGFQEFHNKILNPYFIETRNSTVFNWHSLLGVDVDTPTAIDIDNKTVTYLYTGVGSLVQDLTLKNGISYTVLVESESSNDLADMVIEVKSNSDDIIQNNVLSQVAQVQLVDGFSVLRFKTKDTGILGNIELRITNNSSTENTEITFKNIILTVGNLALLGAQYSELDQKVRWNNTEDFWEISIDNLVTWERIWTDCDDFDIKLSALIDQKIVGLVHQDNIFAGPGITIIPSTIPDGMGGDWPALTISKEIDPTVVSDWTGEDVYYQSLLEGSFFQHVSYNTFETQGNIQLLGGASWSPDEDILGTGAVLGSQNSAFETDNLLPVGSNLCDSFYADAVTEDDIDILIEYSISDGSGYGPWTSCGFKQMIVTPTPFSELKLRYIFNEVGLNKINSFGVLYEVEELSGLPRLGFLETLNIDAVSGTTINIPNGRWYHKDGKSLEIFDDGIRLLENIDYTEVDVGFPNKSNQVTFNYELKSERTLIFKEIYGGTGDTIIFHKSPTIPWIEGIDSYSCEVFEKLMIDTSTNTVTITLPTNPAVGDEVQVIDKHGTFSTNNLILTSADNIMNSSNDYHLSVDFTHATIVFVDLTVGWRVYL